MIKQDCFRFFKMLNLFEKKGNNIFVLDDGNVLINNPRDSKKWLDLIIPKIKVIYKPQIKAIFDIIKNLQEANEEMYVSSIAKRMLEKYKDVPKFLKKDNTPRSIRNFNAITTGIIKILKNVNIITATQFGGGKMLIKVNEQNCKKYLPEIDYVYEEKIVDIIRW